MIKRVVHPHCGAVDKAYYLEPESGSRLTRAGHKSYRRLWKCGECREQFSVLVGMVFEDSKIPLSKWLLGAHEMCTDKSGVISLELAHKFDITQESAWFMADRIRYTIARRPLALLPGGTIEANETCFGRKAKDMNKARRELLIWGRGVVGKTAALTVLERNSEVR